MRTEDATVALEAEDTAAGITVGCRISSPSVSQRTEGMGGGKAEGREAPEP